MRGCALVAVMPIALRAVIVGAVAAAAAVGMMICCRANSCQGFADNAAASPSGIASGVLATSSMPFVEANGTTPA